MQLERKWQGLPSHRTFLAEIGEAAKMALMGKGGSRRTSHDLHELAGRRVQQEVGHDFHNLLLSNVRHDRSL